MTKYKKEFFTPTPRMRKKMNSLTKDYRSLFPGQKREFNRKSLMTAGAPASLAFRLTLDGGFSYFLFKEEIDRC